MAWYTPKYSCGHYGERVQLYGHRSGREAQVARWAAQLCPDCRKERAVAADEAAGLPALTGSPKQVAWASDVRREMLDAMPSLRQQAEARGGDEGAAVVAILDSVAAEASARWWIDHRGSTLRDVVVSEYRRAHPVLGI